MEITRFDIPGLIEFLPQRFVDHRGYFSEIFRKDVFEAEAGVVDFVQENQSLSVKAGTIRGLHFQSEPFAQGKLLRCLAGEIFDVAVDIRSGSPTFGKWAAVTLSAERGNLFWVPPGFAHGFCTLQPNAILCYKVTAYYSRVNDLGLAWDDPDIGIEWPSTVDTAQLSDKDRQQPSFADLPHYFTMEAA